LLPGIGEFRTGRALNFPVASSRPLRACLRMRRPIRLLRPKRWDFLLRLYRGTDGRDRPRRHPFGTPVVEKAYCDTLKSELLSAYRTSTAPQPTVPTPDRLPTGAAQSLPRLSDELDDAQVRALCMAQFDAADNMTDSMAALSALANAEGSEREGALQKFYDKWKDEPLVLDKWFAVQASSRLPDTLAVVKRLMRHPAFTLKNPNRLRSVVSSFCHGNQVRFMRPTVPGYALPRSGRRHRPPQPASRGSPRAQFRPLEKVRCDASRTRASRTRTHPQYRRPLQGHLRSRHPRSGLKHLPPTQRHRGKQRNRG